MRIYLDSNVFISMFQQEIGRDFRGLFIDTDYFIRKAKAEGHILVLSNLFFKEIYKILYMKKEEAVGQNRLIFTPAKTGYAI